jgi:hypothetical protein
LSTERSTPPITAPRKVSWVHKRDHFAVDLERHAGGVDRGGDAGGDRGGDETSNDGRPS